MKSAILVLSTILSITPVFAEQIEICGRFVVSEDAYEGKPANEYLGVTYTNRSWMNYYLKPRNTRQKDLLARMDEGKDYCVTGTPYWCGKDKEFRCLTVNELNVRPTRR
jgi:hypothetical protein